MRVLGTAVGGVILIINMKTFLEAIGIGGVLAYVVYVAVFTLWMATLTHSIFINRL